MRKTESISLLALVVAVTGIGCSDSASGTTTPPPNVTIVEALEPGVECEAGGYTVKQGLDANGDGELAESEVTDTSVVCNGVDGQDGANGAMGSAGERGPAGERGATGLAGDAGGVGPIGPRGEQGATGATGSAGLQGPTGAQGATGTQGGAGAQGATGAQGPTGAQGATGAQGDAGARGPTGAQGAAGQQGEAGEQGVTGVQGDAGPEGAPGTAGDDGHNSLVSVTPLAPGGICSMGGLTITNGLDVDDSGTLDLDEVEDESPLCAGECGNYECGGACGTCDPRFSDTCGDGYCACGTESACTNGDWCRSGVCGAPPNVGCAADVDTGVPAAYDFALGDANGDGRVDIVGSVVDFYLATRNVNGSYTTVQTFNTGNEAYGIAFGDVDDDDDLDIITGGPNGSSASPNTVFVNNGVNFDSGTTLYDSHALAFYGTGVVATDVNADGITDVVWSTFNTIQVAIGPYTSNGSPDAFPVAPASYSISTTASNSNTIGAADLDSDGDTDIFTSHYENPTNTDGEVALLLNDGAGVFTELAIKASNTAFFTGDYVNAFAIVTGDFNQDGNPDLAFANNSVANTGIIIALRTSADGATPAYTFSKPNLGIANGLGYSLVAADFDGDGKSDLVGGPVGDARLLVGAGDGTFTPTNCSLDGVQDPIAYDVNGDSALDLAYISGGTVHVRYAE